MSPSPLDWHGRFLEIETKNMSVLGEQFLPNAIQTPYLCSITIGIVVCIYKGTTDLLSEILKSHSPLETNTWTDCSGCYIGKGFVASSNRKVTKKKNDNRFRPSLISDCRCLYRVVRSVAHIRLARIEKITKGCSNELCGQFLLGVGFSVSGTQGPCCCRRGVLLVVDIGV